jgi:hypothetical protein
MSTRRRKTSRKRRAKKSQSLSPLWWIGIAAGLYALNAVAHQNSTMGGAGFGIQPSIAASSDWSS